MLLGQGDAKKHARGPPKTHANMIKLTSIGLTVQLPDFLANEALYCPEPSPCCRSSLRHMCFCTTRLEPVQQPEKERHFSAQILVSVH